MKVEEAGEQQLSSVVSTIQVGKNNKEKSRPKVCAEWFESKNKIKEEKKRRETV